MLVAGFTLLGGIGARVFPSWANQRAYPQYSQLDGCTSNHQAPGYFAPTQPSYSCRAQGP